MKTTGKVRHMSNFDSAVALGLFRATLLLAALLLFAATAQAENPLPPPSQPTGTTTADELHDLMLSAMIHYRSSIYMPSKELALYCEAFRGGHHKKSCAQDMEKVVAGESAAQALIAKMDANPADLPVDYEILFIGPELNDVDEAQLRPATPLARGKPLVCCSRQLGGQPFSR